MSPSTILKTTVVSVLTILLVLSPFSPLPLGPQPTVAQTADCGVAGETLELKYDSGIAVGQMQEQFGGCQQCQTYQGVLFSLPEGTSSSVLRKVRLYAGGGKANIRIHIMNSTDGFHPGDELTTPIVTTISEKAGQGNWYEVSLPDLQVPNMFWVFCEMTNLKVAPFFDERRIDPVLEGRSWSGYTPYELSGAFPDQFKRPQGDFLIRAYIVPEATVGKGTDYDYQSIQEAIDSVWDGWRITVSEGTYEENVTVNKSVTVSSVSGPAKTTVQTSPRYPDNNVFTITASCVSLSGFTIQNAAYAGRAGVRIEGAIGCVVSGNVMLDNNYGIYVSEDSTGNILLENECTSNTTGIYIDGSDNYISGNKLHGNTTAIGSAVYMSSISSGNQLRFNTVTLDPGTDPGVADDPQIYNGNTSQQASAVENWWGTDTGPFNADGQGPVVGDMVLFAPWLRKQPVRVQTVAGQEGTFILDSRSVTSSLVVKDGAGKQFISIASFAENPAGEFRYKSLGRWIDVLLSSSQGVDQVEIRAYYTTDEVAALNLKEGSLRLFWWNGEKWKACSKTSVDTKNDFVWAKLNLKTKPTPSDLTGTMFAVGIPKGGFAWWLIPLILVLLVILVVVFRLFWVLVVGRGRYAVD